MTNEGPADRRNRTPKGFRRGISILPALFTIGNLLMGFRAIILTLQGHYASASVCIGIAIVLDLLDGRIARLTGTSSEFGGELDSLADVISFGVAPAVLLYRWGFEAAIPRQGWVVAFVFVTCGTLRLARFNVQRHVVDSRYFVGLPIPAAAGQAAAVVYATREPITEPFGLVMLVLLATISLSLLMVSTIRYRSFKSFDLRSRRSAVHVLAVALGMALIFSHPRQVLLAVATIYTVSGPFMQATSFLFRRRGDPPPAAALPNEAH
jgi:CDP-diacylglycerol---serine O-phosphatidyltransferase